MSARRTVVSIRKSIFVIADRTYLRVINSDQPDDFVSFAARDIALTRTLVRTLYRPSGLDSDSIFLTAAHPLIVWNSLTQAEPLVGLAPEIQLQVSGTAFLHHLHVQKLRIENETSGAHVVNPTLYSPNVTLFFDEAGISGSRTIYLGESSSGQQRVISAHVAVLPPLQILGSTTVHGNAEIRNGNIIAGGDVQLNSLQVHGNWLKVDGGDILLFPGDVQINGPLTVGGQATLGGQSALIDGPLQCAADAQFSGDAVHLSGLVCEVFGGLRVDALDESAQLELVTPILQIGEAVVVDSISSSHVVDFHAATPDISAGATVGLSFFCHSIAQFDASMSLDAAIEIAAAAGPRLRVMADFTAQTGFRVDNPPPPNNENGEVSIAPKTYTVGDDAVFASGNTAIGSADGVLDVYTKTVFHRSMTFGGEDTNERGLFFDNVTLRFEQPVALHGGISVFKAFICHVPATIHGDMFSTSATDEFYCEPSSNFVGGNVSITDVCTVSSAVQTATLSISGSSHFGNTSSSGGGANPGSSLVVAGTTTVHESLAVSKSAMLLGSAIQVDTNLSAAKVVVNNALSVVSGGTTTLVGPVHVLGNLQLSAASVNVHTGGGQLRSTESVSIQSASALTVDASTISVHAYTTDSANGAHVVRIFGNVFAAIMGKFVAQQNQIVGSVTVAHGLQANAGFSAIGSLVRLQSARTVFSGTAANVYGNVSISRSVTCTGTLTMPFPPSVNAPLTVHPAARVVGLLQCAGSAVFDTHCTFGSDLRLTGSASIHAPQNWQINNNLAINDGGVAVQTMTIVAGDVVVESGGIRAPSAELLGPECTIGQQPQQHILEVFSHSATVNCTAAPVSVHGELTTGDVVFSSDVNVENSDVVFATPHDVSVSGSAYFPGTCTVGSAQTALQVYAPAVTLNGTLSVAQSATFNSSISAPTADLFSVHAVSSDLHGSLVFSSVTGTGTLATPTVRAERIRAVTAATFNGSVIASSGGSVHLNNGLISNSTAHISLSTALAQNNGTVQLSGTLTAHLDAQLRGNTITMMENVTGPGAAYAPGATSTASCTIHGNAVYAQATCAGIVNSTSMLVHSVAHMENDVNILNGDLLLQNGVMGVTVAAPGSARFIGATHLQSSLSVLQNLFCSNALLVNGSAGVLCKSDGVIAGGTLNVQGKLSLYTSGRVTVHSTLTSRAGRMDLRQNTLLRSDLRVHCPVQFKNSCSVLTSRVPLPDEQLLPVYLQHGSDLHASLATFTESVSCEGNVEMLTKEMAIAGSLFASSCSDILFSAAADNPHLLTGTAITITMVPAETAAVQALQKVTVQSGALVCNAGCTVTATECIVRSPECSVAEGILSELFSVHGNATFTGGTDNTHTVFGSAFSNGSTVIHRLLVTDSFTVRASHAMVLLSRTDSSGAQATFTVNNASEFRGHCVCGGNVSANVTSAAFRTNTAQLLGALSVEAAAAADSMEIGSADKPFVVSASERCSFTFLESSDIPVDVTIRANPGSELAAVLSGEKMEMLERLRVESASVSFTPASFSGSGTVVSQGASSSLTVVSTDIAFTQGVSMFCTTMTVLGADATVTISGNTTCRGNVIIGSSDTQPPSELIIAASAARFNGTTTTGQGVCFISRGLLTFNSVLRAEEVKSTAKVTVQKKVGDVRPAQCTIVGSANILTSTCTFGTPEPIAAVPALTVHCTAVLYSNLEVQGTTALRCDVTVDGNVTCRSSVDVTSNGVQVEVRGDFSNAGASEFYGDLNVHARNMIVNGNATVFSPGETVLYQNCEFERDVTVTARLTRFLASNAILRVLGNTTIISRTVILSSAAKSLLVRCNSAQFSGGSVTVAGKLRAAKSITSSGELRFGETVVLRGSLTVENSLLQTTTFSQSLSLRSSLTVRNMPTRIVGSLQVPSGNVFASTLSIGEVLQPVQTVTLWAAFSRLHGAEAASIYGSLFASTLGVTGAFRASTPVTISDNASISGSTYITDSSVRMRGALAVQGMLSIPVDSRLNVRGNLEVKNTNPGTTLNVSFTGPGFLVRGPASVLGELHSSFTVPDTGATSHATFHDGNVLVSAPPAQTASSSSFYCSVRRPMAFGEIQARNGEYISKFRFTLLTGVYATSVVHIRTPISGEQVQTFLLPSDVQNGHLATIVNLTHSPCIIMAMQLNFSSWFNRYMILEPGGILELIYISGVLNPGNANRWAQASWCTITENVTSYFANQALDIVGIVE